MNKFLAKIINKLLRANIPPARYAVKLKRKYRLKTFEKADKKILEICGGIMPISKENINKEELKKIGFENVAEYEYDYPTQNSKFYMKVTAEKK